LGATNAQAKFCTAALACREIFKPPSNPSTTTDAPTADAVKRAAQNVFFANLKQAYMAGGKLKCMVLGVELPRSALTAGHLFPKWLASKVRDVAAWRTKQVVLGVGEGDVHVLSGV
jgi:hypothetical protein